MSDVRRFDELVRVVRDERRRVDDFRSTVLARLGSTATGGGGAVDSVNGQTGVVVLDSADVGADPAGTAAAAVTAHEAAADPHPGYLTAAEGTAAYATLGHNHAGDLDADVGFVATQQTTTSTVYADLTTVGPTVTVTAAAARRVLVIYKAQVFQQSTTDDVFMSYAASGATVDGASDLRALRHNGSGTQEAYASFGYTDVNAGTTTFTAKYRVDGGTGRFENRTLAVIPI